MREILPSTFDVMLDFDRAQSLKAVHNVLMRHAAPTGAKNVLAAIIPDRPVVPSQQAQYLVLGEWPQQWIERYFERQYVRQDPTLAHVLRSLDPLMWSELNLQQRDPGLRVMNEAKEFHLVEGITIPQLTLDGKRIAVSFSGERLDRSPASAMRLMVLAAYAVARALELRALGPHRPQALSARERECLKWASEGKSSSEMALILGVTVKSIEKHLSSSRTKLGAATTVQAVVLALRAGEV